VFERIAGPALLRLTPRQTEILTWVAEGKQNKEISKILAISPRTVQHHLERVYERLGVENRTAAASMLLAAKKAPRS
jgi:DNA-binding CsgD family transcriptional regulator